MSLTMKEIEESLGKDYILMRKRAWFAALGGALATVVVLLGLTWAATAKAATKKVGEAIVEHRLDEVTAKAHSDAATVAEYADEAVKLKGGICCRGGPTH